MADDTDNRAVFDHLLKVLLELFLSKIILPLLGVLREGLPLCFVPNSKRKMTSLVMTSAREETAFSHDIICSSEGIGAERVALTTSGWSAQLQFQLIIKNSIRKLRFLVSDEERTQYIPVLIESSPALLADVLGPDRLEGSETMWGFDIANDPHNNHRWSLNNCDSLNNFLLVGLYG